MYTIKTYSLHLGFTRHGGGESHAQRSNLSKCILSFLKEVRYKITQGSYPDIWGISSHFLNAVNFWTNTRRMSRSYAHEEWKGENQYSQWLSKDRGRMLRHPAHLQRGDIVHNLFCSFNCSFVHSPIHLWQTISSSYVPNTTLEWKYGRKKKNRQVPCSLGNYNTGMFKSHLYPTNYRLTCRKHC